MGASVFEVGPALSMLDGTTAHWARMGLELIECWSLFFSGRSSLGRALTGNNSLRLIPDGILASLHGIQFGEVMDLAPESYPNSELYNQDWNVGLNLLLASWRVEAHSPSESVDSPNSLPGLEDTQSETSSTTADSAGEESYSDHF